MTTPPAPGLIDPASRRALYARLWLSVPRELGYLLPILPIAIASLSVLTSVFWTGLGLSFVFVGLFIVLGALFIARGFGMVEVIRLKYSGFPAITPPAWDRKARSGGSFAKAFAPFIDGHYWLYLLWAMVVGPILGLVTWTIAFFWVVTAVAGTSYWLYSGLIPRGDGVHFTRLSTSGSDFANGVVTFVIGVIALLTLPYVTRGLTWLHWQVAHGMLGVFAAEQLQQQVAGLATSRSAAVAAEGTALRRLERDIHDGPQQRLVRLQMDLAAADRQMDADPAAARTLIAEAMQQSRDALEELRALSRGFAPPLLLDRGLVAALDSMATRSSIPVRLVAELPEGATLPPETERNAYFIVAEAVTNAEKHSAATSIKVRVAESEAGDSSGTWLDLTVSDDGIGGAAATPGHGIAGLEERVLGLGGILSLVSPVGGPTVVTVQLPLGSAAAPSMPTAFAPAPAPEPEPAEPDAPAAPKKPGMRKPTS
jgi:signal transduction histidine kinase